MTANGHNIVRLEFTSAFEMLDFVQVVSDHLARGIGLDEDSRHWVSVAIRESVINAIKHGNRSDASKHVFVEFETATPADVAQFHAAVAPVYRTLERQSATASFIAEIKQLRRNVDASSGPTTACPSAPSPSPQASHPRTQHSRATTGRSRSSATGTAKISTSGRWTRTGTGLPT